MSITGQGEVWLSVAGLLYLAVPAVMLLRGWMIAAGLSMTLAIILPAIWATMLPDSDLDTPGVGFLAPLLLPAGLFILVGTIRFFQRRTIQQDSN